MLLFTFVMRTCIHFFTQFDLLGIIVNVYGMKILGEQERLTNYRK